MSVFPGLEISNTRNTGVAFGAFQDGGVIVAVLIGVSLVLLIGYFLRNSDHSLAVAAGGDAARRRARQPRRPRP